VNAGEPELWRAVTDLPTKQRAAVLLRFAGDLAYREIGAATATTEEAARRNVHEGLKKLREGWVA
jgi:RNA polymerase sigma-70 factor (ECF subfamily)